MMPKLVIPSFGERLCDFTDEELALASERCSTVWVFKSMVRVKLPDPAWVGNHDYINQCWKGQRGSKKTLLGLIEYCMRRGIINEPPACGLPTMDQQLAVLVRGFLSTNWRRE